MAVIPAKANSFLSRLKTPPSLQALYNSLVKAGIKPQYHSGGEIHVSKWKKMDSRALGITHKMVPSPPLDLLRILRAKGFQSYLVGGCVRDLLLNRTPKDFDVITTADLRQIRKHFNRCVIVGRRFPICLVHIKGSIIEVSSFETLGKHAQGKGKEKFLVSQLPRGCEKSDLNLWKNSMRRDFTINGLFFDPLVQRIYDFTDGMKDLLDLKLRTIVPAQMSFKEDCARILRGLRIAARLGLSFSKDIEIAIRNHTPSILALSMQRILMEFNYMLSFGAAESSLRMLHRFQILESLLPFQAAYISQQATRPGQSSMMLMKLFSNLDKLVTCDRPCDSRLWIGLLAFHMALVNKPQDPFVVLAFASILYRQKWEEGLCFARQRSQSAVGFEPEISEPHDFISDDEIAEKVNQLALLVVDTIDGLVDTKSLRKTMAKYPGCPCPGLVFIPKSTGSRAAQLFRKVETYKGRASFEIDYDLLRKGDPSETRSALGNIILNTMVHPEDDYHAPNTKKQAIAPKDKMVISKKQAIAPKEKRVIPEKQAVAPKDKMVIPEKQAVAPEEKRVIPERQAVAPKDKKVIPEKQDIAPKEKKVISKKQDIVPKEKRVIAEVGGMIQDDKKQDAETANKVEQEQRVCKKQRTVSDTSLDPEKEDKATETTEGTGVCLSPTQKLVSMLESLAGNQEEAEMEIEHSVEDEQEIKRKKNGEGLLVANEMSLDSRNQEDKSLGHKPVDNKVKRVTRLSALFK